ncbi:unnamed protein product [Mytilus edulis]|uniref:Uncharacterized protein n=1 Tax=Mytilus edulis TaxID=6550 RepID=A0A8S3U2R1_MYTED|nr:unnamed protein product [Mytilus edulis]
MMDWTGPPVQTQSQKQRSMEASKEKIYRIHGNVINILEELEERTQRSRGKKPLPKSKTDYYDHSEKDDETVDEVVQGQLITFQSIIKACDPRVKQSVKDELEKKTKKWMEVRRQEGADRDDIDRYAHMMLDIITHGQTSHSKDFLKSKSVNHDAFTHEDVQTIITASHKSAAVDREFQRDPNRKAKPYEIRSPGKGE